MMVVKRMINKLHWLYWQFQLITMSYLMDPFEWWLFHSCLLVFFMGWAYFLYAVVPSQISLVLTQICYLFGLPSESTVPAMM